jgi:hypothetical protein
MGYGTPTVPSAAAGGVTTWLVEFPSYADCKKAIRLMRDNRIRRELYMWVLVPSVRRLCAWRRRDLNKRVRKEGERAEAKKEQEEALEDTKLGITPGVLVAAHTFVLAESLPTVEITFKNRTNNPRRTRPFSSIDNLSFKNRTNDTCCTRPLEVSALSPSCGVRRLLRVFSARLGISWCFQR